MSPQRVYGVSAMITSSILSLSPQDTTVSRGYQRWQEAGKNLSKPTPPPKVPNPYAGKTTDALKTLKQEATTWLDTHRTHPKYAEAQRRYLQLSSALLANLTNDKAFNAITEALF